MSLRELKKELLEKYPALRYRKRTREVQGDAPISLEHASEFEMAGSIFSVRDGGMSIYPLFQFDENTRKPRPVIRELIYIFDLSRHDSWELFIWLTSPTGLLGGAVPVDLLDSAPSQVLEAARRERAEPEF